eukprot:TRINITY_DN19721_c0_g1_i1.p2 TRINITY_DN19721_c0_g1~~TRINITY_DN19721_c0_g1_i1.p2  ORF type:complete len:220 (-),score=63.44 TRINITY_DN19721_c0_g1_i1:69-728(-)
MPSRTNGMIPESHLRKDWDRRVKTWFNQPARKYRRHQNRLKKAAAVFPRPVAGNLRPGVQAPTNKHNSLRRVGRGFTLQELKAAGIKRSEAPKIGIAVDYRRRNKSDSSLSYNVQRLKEYRSKLVILPKAHKPKESQKAAVEEFAKATQHTGELFPVKQTAHVLQTVTKAQLEELRKAPSSYVTLKQARTAARLVGVREKRRKEAEAKAVLAEKKATKA